MANDAEPLRRVMGRLLVLVPLLLLPTTSSFAGERRACVEEDVTRIFEMKGFLPIIEGDDAVYGALRTFDRCRADAEAQVWVAGTNRSPITMPYRFKVDTSVVDGRLQGCVNWSRNSIPPIDSQICFEGK